MKQRCGDLGMLTLKYEANLAREKDRVKYLSNLEELGVIQPACPLCREMYMAQEPWNVTQESHTASVRCESGSKPHCTCDVCF